jgi:hypothetical protein
MAAAKANAMAGKSCEENISNEDPEEQGATANIEQAHHPQTLAFTVGIKKRKKLTPLKSRHGTSRRPVGLRK